MNLEGAINYHYYQFPPLELDLGGGVAPIDKIC